MVGDRKSAFCFFFDFCEFDLPIFQLPFDEFHTKVLREFFIARCLIVQINICVFWQDIFSYACGIEHDMKSQFRLFDQTFFKLSACGFGRFI